MSSERAPLGPCDRRSRRSRYWDARQGKQGVWTEDGLLRQVVYLGEGEDKPAAEVRRDPPAV